MYIMNYYLFLTNWEKTLPFNMHKLFASLINPSLQTHVPLLLFDPVGWQISFSPHSCWSRPTSQTLMLSFLTLELSRVGSNSNHDFDFLGRTRTILVCLFLSLFATSVLVGVVGKQYLSSVQNVWNQTIQIRQVISWNFLSI